MAKDVKTRIEERNQAAELHRKDQGAIRRAVSGAGLFVANTWDRVTSPFKRDGNIFGAATTFGAMNGAVMGGLVGIAAMLLTMGGTMAAPVLSPIAIPLLIGLTSIGAVIGGARQGQKSLERHWNAKNHQLADTIAEKTGAVKAPHKFKGDVGSTPEEELKRSGHDPKLLQRAEEVTSNDPSFVQREEMRKNRGPIVLNR